MPEKNTVVAKSRAFSEFILAAIAGFWTQKMPKESSPSRTKGIGIFIYNPFGFVHFIHFIWVMWASSGLGSFFSCLCSSNADGSGFLATGGRTFLGKRGQICGLIGTASPWLTLMGNLIINPDDDRFHPDG